jgi:hypothetical protein
VLGARREVRHPWQRLLRSVRGEARPEHGQEDRKRHDPEPEEEPGAAAAEPGEIASLAGSSAQDAATA